MLDVQETLNSNTNEITRNWRVILKQLVWKNSEITLNYLTSLLS